MYSRIVRFHTILEEFYTHRYLGLQDRIQIQDKVDQNLDFHGPDIFRICWTCQMKNQIVQLIPKLLPKHNNIQLWSLWLAAEKIIQKPQFVGTFHHQEVDCNKNPVFDLNILFHLEMTDILPCIGKCILHDY